MSPTTEAAKLDRLTEQVEEMAAELRAQRQARERWAELSHDLTPVLSGAMEKVSDELSALDAEVSLDDLGRLARHAAASAARLDALLVQLESLAQLGEEVTHLAGPAMGTVTERLAELEQKGYFSFFRQGAVIADNVVTSFTEDDVRALGENIVLILQTVKEMTQPEVMTMLRNTVTAQQVEMPATPPSTFALLRQMRQPEVRRGLARALSMLRTLGEEQASTTPKEGLN